MDSLTSQQILEVSKDRHYRLNLNVSGPILVGNAREMQQIMQDTDNLVKAANHEFKLQDLHYVNKKWSITALMISIALLAIAFTSIIFIVVRKFRIFNAVLSAIGVESNGGGQGNLVITFPPHLQNQHE